MLNLNGITVRLGGRTILDRAGAAIPPGSRVGLIGRNGAGKSTLMKVMIGEIDPDEGDIDMPRTARIGYLQQEAPSGTATPLETVIAADRERSELLAESETCRDMHRLGDIHERLNAIDAYSAEARAARILVGLGFDEDMQGRPLDSYSGGWKMRVALAALLFSQPDLLLLDEPSNHLDLEATLWLENFLKSYRATLVVISHERDLLNNVVDHILHVENGRTKMYVGGYDSFERQRAEHLAQAGAARRKQEVEREKLQAFVDRWRAKASKAKQAQSRMKALEKMTPIAAALEDPSLSFEFPSSPELKPPLITLDMASVGYDERPILKRLNLRIDPDERIALLGKNGNGKTTLARLLAAQLCPMDGEMNASRKMTVGYFTQYQVEELETDATPLEHMTRQMPGEKQSKVRAQLGRFGFSGERATQRVGSLSGGERARLALALITRHAPHLLILDEPTNHLDVDTREALVQALNDYQGAVVIVSHDRHMIELVADRLVLVADGTAENFDGTLEDYTSLVLGRTPAKRAGSKDAAPPRKTSTKSQSADTRRILATLRGEVASAEKRVAALTRDIAIIDQAVLDPAISGNGAAIADLMKRRTAVEAELREAEEAWLTAEAALEDAA
ncbi:ABC-F family ATP-binding cassette domain-containing protein [Pacificimonas flava]|uniref:Glutathione-regulated potassium-efflux system ATP-binding protein n=1 Tax=Pacificimonas flava TaxID=1234595 RepID=M2TR16_9SPHN|nr:ABC-F family ATP-binding cassette domain-containing protein [Pacificimonas flava]EMD84246.1 Glutathione-regulated potassium-efflux system ATP-binding protein [Pacificimonas flava]MBB5279877.1 ATP-binding cassette subfamily F protein 3 [Pacificimonas flava]